MCPTPSWKYCFRHVTNHAAISFQRHLSPLKSNYKLGILDIVNLVKYVFMWYIKIPGKTANTFEDIVWNAPDAEVWQDEAALWCSYSIAPSVHSEM